MWPLWLFLTLAALTFLVIAGLAGYADYMGRPGSTNYLKVAGASVLFSGLVTVLALGVAALLS